MHQVTPPQEEQRPLRTVPSAGDAGLLAEVVELRARNEQLGRALASRAVIDQARGMVRAWRRVPATGPGTCWWTCRSTATSSSGTWLHVARGVTALL
jgi:hypothetical protein